MRHGYEAQLTEKPFDAALERDPYAYDWFTPRVVGMALPALSVQGLRAAAELQLELEDSGCRVVGWNVDNGFARNNYMHELQRKRFERELNFLGLGRRRSQVSVSA